MTSDFPNTCIEEALFRVFSETRSLPWDQVAAMGSPQHFQILAARFHYNVNQGGFAQLFYNMEGNLLGEIEDMLIAVKASVAHKFYVRAVEMCLQNQIEYSRFLASNYVEANELKHQLQLLSVEYLSQSVSFVAEAAELLAGLTR